MCASTRRGWADRPAHDGLESIRVRTEVRRSGDPHVINQTKGLVLALFAAYWLIVIVVLVTARDVYDQQFPVKLSGDQRPAEIGALLVLTALFGVLSTGIIRNWRWTFWLIMFAFMAGILRAPISALQLTGALPAQGPAWFLALQVVVGLVQFVIGLAMFAGYRKAGIWGEL